MTWSQAETKLYRIKVAVDEIEQLKFECDAAILAASAHVEEQTAAEHNPGIANATARSGRSTSALLAVVSAP